jgi:ferric-dicitrate binding protein FerR (iron transport regulator)
MPPYPSFVASANAVAAEQQDLQHADPVHEHAFDFATHSWDLATGGFKTLTAKREYPLRSNRRPSSKLEEDAATARNYIFGLIVMICVLLMLVGGGIVLFVMLQP